ncbi:hypothetical protein F2Q70_00013060 [Brassica cretica]|uniref:phospholipase D n=1 Tax=Brassica cretica TaxID=69181 RepID=A0A8S9M8R3_BRACR|nr:hypothetical protein F2Q70_00013060 [Brassica cretica]
MNEVLNSKERWEGACVIDNVLYFHDRSGEKAFDPKQSRWSAVNGLEEFLAVEVTNQSMWSKVVKCREKRLALFFPKKREGNESGAIAPRQPWHDMHCRLDGPAAYDVLINFEQRWRKATRWKEFNLNGKTLWQDDSLLRIGRISWILNPKFKYRIDGVSHVPEDDPIVYVSNEDNPENWHVQVFRSIDSGSVKGFPKFENDAGALHLEYDKRLVVDKSIQTAYIQIIRSAQHFIYIENQYFLGSSYAWLDYNDAGADNLIPMELALKITSKIRAKERFAVYVVIPMWPEGDPKSGPMQEILYWQSQTMQMMYDVIARELKSVQSNAHPLDYLNFYCLGKREQFPDHDMPATNVTDSYKFKRFMIYVHAKGMVVDDEYVLMGSANINQRSMAGTKDTEIAMGAYQPHHTWANKGKHPRGQSGAIAPRQPWHDMHYGVSHVPEDDPVVYVSNEDDPENWHVQVFRSIDSGSVKGFPKCENKAEALHLEFDKRLVVDKSIQTAYIQKIRSAQHFIYIENQYFLGSSYAWPDYNDAGADNLIPMELALKITSKIRAKERFAVYVVIPMWPEGDPKSGPMQEILYWQMMYDVIARELKSHQSNARPLDYLNFYCLGKREQLPDDMPATNVSGVTDSYKFQRFMIYVHAKGMVVDDEYVLMGSANINQRSMAGTKDTEIAMGAYQPHHTWANKGKHPRGQVYGYRMSLWAEHLGKTGDEFVEPGDLECVKNVNEIAERNWRKFIDSELSELQGHLIKYPLDVDIDGNVISLPGYDSFPDVGGKIIGDHSKAIPDTLTT